MTLTKTIGEFIIHIKTIGGKKILIISDYQLNNLYTYNGRHWQTYYPLGELFNRDELKTIKKRFYNLLSDGQYYSLTENHFLIL